MTTIHSIVPRLALALLTLAAVAACGAGASEPAAPTDGDVEVLDVSPELVDDTVVSGGPLLVEVRGTELLVPRSVTVELDGTIDGAEVDDFTIAEFEDKDGHLLLTVPWSELESVFGVDGDGVFQGQVRVTVQDIGGSIEGRGAINDTSITFASTLTPTVQPPGEFDVFLNHLTEWDGQGVLREGEGQTWLAVSGTFEVDGGESHAVDDRIPVNVGAEGRDSAVVNWLPYVFGIEPGRFTGEVAPVNVAESGQETLGDSRGVTITLNPTELDGFTEPAASRGEIATLVGRGFIAADTERGQSMFFELEGTYFLTDGSELELTGNEVVRIAPESVPSFTEAEIVLRSETVERGGVPQLVGITAMPGTFQGRITPVLVDGSTTIRGVAHEGEFTITPTRQIVYVKFLPGFSTSLDVYGLRNVEPEIRTRIFDVIERDYRNHNVGFTDTEPEDFVEYSLIEVGGPDPNDAGLFGLDNTAGKDTGNIRLNDWIGGTNAESGELGYYVFGGVFIESFTTFSPSLDSGSEVASATFDEIFSPFMPQLGGTVIDAAEWPEGPRSEEIDMAIHAFGSVIGNTITHEIGHSLGLAFFPEDEFSPGNRFHNDFDEPGAIMDSGGNRPFEERAELEGAAAPEFNSRNRAYLDRILPIP